MIKNLTILLFFPMLIFCSKHNSPINQTSQLLENNWTFASETFIYPPNPNLDSVYSGISFNYFQFTANNTIIASLGNPAISTYTTNYYLQNDSTILIYSQNSISQYISYTIEKLIQDSLILTTIGNREDSNITYRGIDQLIFYR